MTGVDTNVLVRLLAADDPAQTDRARKLFERGEIWLAKTVLLETEWVLRSAYGIVPAGIATAFRQILATKGVRVEDHEGVEQAIELYGKGCDWADALHLVSCREVATRFATFDTQMRLRTASEASLPKVIVP